MISIKNMAANIIRITIPKTLKADDFAQFAPRINGFIQQHGTIRLLVDATAFDGWENMSAFDKHIGFVKAHQQKVERIAIIAGHMWQHWVAGIFRIFVHPQVMVFDENESAEAARWIAQ